MKKQIHVAMSPLTGSIFAGHVLKGGLFWESGKQGSALSLKNFEKIALYIEGHQRPVGD